MAMERVFSVEDEEIPNLFWAPPPSPAPVVQPRFGEGAGGVGGLGLGGGVAEGGSGGGVMESDRTEWGLQKFLEDALLHGDGQAANPVLCPSTVVELAGGSGTRPDGGGDSDVEVVKVNPAPAPAPPASEVADPVAYNEMLRRKLDEDLAAVAMWKVSGDGRSGANLVQNEGVNVINSSSSGASDDDMERQTTTVGDMNVTAHKAKRRKESNRDSARRSRSRKAAHLRDMEDQLSDLKVENNTLLRRLTQVVQKYNNSAVDCRVLRAKVETLETKLKMAETNLMRVTGTTNVSQAISSLTTPFTSYQHDSATASGTVSVPIQDAPVSYVGALNTTQNRLNGNSYILRATSAFRNGDDLAAASPRVQAFASMGHTVRGGGPAAAVSRPPWAAPPGGFERASKMRMWLGAYAETNIF